MRRRTIYSLLAIPVLLGVTSMLLALAARHGKGPMPAQPDWPKGLEKLVNFKGKVGGFFVNANDFFFFRGDTATLNEFLELYSSLKGTPLTVTVNANGEQPPTGGLHPDDHYDWSLSLIRRGWGAPPAPPGSNEKYVISVTIWVDTHIRLEKLYLLGPIMPLVLPEKRR